MSFDPGLPDDHVNVSQTHPLREAGLLLAGVVGVAVLAVVVSAAVVDRVVPLLPLGFETWLFGSGWLTPDAAETEDGEVDAQRVRELVERMSAHWEDNPYDFRVVLWEHDTPNALAFPGGWIVVTRGLLDQAGSENELAFVIAHELGHFRNRDHLRGLGRGLALAFVTGALGLSGADAAGQLATLAGQLADRGFGREQERDADRFGLDLLAAEYGHVAGAPDFFARMRAEEGAESGGRIAHYLSTHPLHDERIDALRAEAAARGYAVDGVLTPLSR